MGHQSNARYAPTWKSPSISSRSILDTISHVARLVKSQHLVFIFFYAWLTIQSTFCRVRKTESSDGNLITAVRIVFFSRAEAMKETTIMTWVSLPPPSSATDNTKITTQLTYQALLARHQLEQRLHHTEQGTMLELPPNLVWYARTAFFGSISLSFPLWLRSLTFPSPASLTYVIRCYTYKCDWMNMYSALRFWYVFSLVSSGAVVITSSIISWPEWFSFFSIWLFVATRRN